MQKIGVKRFGLKNAILKRNADNFGPEFLRGGLKPWRNEAEKFARKIRHQNLLRHFWAIFPKFARPKHPKSALQSLRI